MIEEMKLLLKTAGELCYGEQGKRLNFYIPSYQRGYRWSSKNVKKLLDDIKEFEASGDNFYCLQPIAIKKLKAKETDTDIFYEVVDGQQRLTTIFILLKVLKYQDGELPFKLLFERDGGQDIRWNFLENIETCHAFDDSIVDLVFMKNAFNSALKWLSLQGGSGRVKSDMREKLAHHTKVIWYELSEKHGGISYDVFDNLNGGKIGLTSSELVKAMIVRHIGEKGDVAARLWDEIEKQLGEKDFWAFITQDKIRKHNYYETRTDYILELLYRLSKGNKEKEPIKPEIVLEYFEAQFDVPLDGRKKVAENMLKRIRDFFRYFQDWYIDVEMYNYIGYVITQNICTVQEVLDLYKDNNKSVFKDKLKKIIAESIGIDDKKSIEDIQRYLSGDSIAVTVAQDIEADEADGSSEQGDEEESTTDESEKTIGYGTAAEKAKVVKILLAFNAITSIRRDKKFSFSTDGGWSIEHIFAQNSQNVVKTERESFVRGYIDATKSRIEHLQTGDSIGELKDLLDRLAAYIQVNEFVNKENFTRIFTVIAEVFEKDAPPKTHALANLALLGKMDNSKLNDSAFPIKRRDLLRMAAENHNIPICTEHIFAKAYSGEVTNFYYWSKSDGEKYIRKMAEMLFLLR